MITSFSAHNHHWAGDSVKHREIHAIRMAMTACRNGRIDWQIIFRTLRTIGIWIRLQKLNAIRRIAGPLLDNGGDHVVRAASPVSLSARARLLEARLPNSIRSAFPERERNVPAQGNPTTAALATSSF
jgi:hypothetical protein